MNHGNYEQIKRKLDIKKERFSEVKAEVKLLASEISKYVPSDEGLEKVVQNLKKDILRLDEKEGKLDNELLKIMKVDNE